MPIIDFTEIPVANKGGGSQDSFELFAREFLDKIGFKIIDGPDRGADLGRDIIVSEMRRGIVGFTEVRWLVSCKHKAHSGQSVQQNDEINISDRIQAHGCNGFIGFYSTIISSGLSKILDGIKVQNGFEIIIFDSEKIERVLLEDERLRGVLQRFFPQAFRVTGMKRPSNLFERYSPLKCKVCGKDLIHTDVVDKYEGNIIFVSDRQFYYLNNGKAKIVDVYCVCKGECDSKMEHMEFANNHSTSWNDISDLIIPIEYLKFIIAIMNRMRSGYDIYTDEAYEKLKDVIVCLSQMTLRYQTNTEIKRSVELSMLPEGL